MANANTPIEFTGDQGDTVQGLALVMKGVAAVLLLLGAINLMGGILTLLGGSFGGLLNIIEGLVTLLLGLVMLSASRDVRFTAQTKFPAIHLGNAFEDLAMFYKVQFFLAIFLGFVTLIGIFAG
jgi:hypothetical protein